MIKVLELFSGTETISNAFRKRGCECFTVDWNEIFPSSLHCNIANLKTEDLPEEFQHPDIIYAAPDHKTYSLSAIQKHRKKDPKTGALEPISEDAINADNASIRMVELIKEMQPKIWWIEAPRACFQKMPWMKPLEKYKHVITYCRYMQELPKEARKQRVTNIWTNIPNPGLLPPCMRKSDCHPSTPRGSKKTGPQGMMGDILRTTYPKALTEAIVNISMDYLQKFEEELDDETHVKGATAEANVTSEEQGRIN